MNNITLSPEQLEYYHENGYVPLGKIMEDATLEAMRTEAALLKTEWNQPATPRFLQRVLPGPSSFHPRRHAGFPFS